MKVRPRLLDDTVDLLDAFEASRVEYVVVGAHALAAHGIPRATADFDVLVRPSPENARRVIEALERFGAPLRAHGLVAADFERPATVYQMGLPPRRIDVLTSISGVEFAEAWSTRVDADIDGRRVPVLGRAALVMNKRASGRPKDLLDVAALLKHGSGT